VKTNAFVGAVFLIVVAGSMVSAETRDRDAIIRALIERSQLLEDTHFAVPKTLWKEYIRDTVKNEPLPVGFILAEGQYSVFLPEDPADAKLSVRLSLHVFDPERCRKIPMLPERLVWRDVLLNGKPVKAVVSKEWLCFTFTEPGEYVLAAEASLARGDVVERPLVLDVPRSVRTLLRFESPDAWQIDPEQDVRRIRGVAGGTRGEIAFSPRGRLAFTCRRPEVTTDRPPKFQFHGDVAWNLDAGTQQVAACLEVVILGGSTDRIELRLPADAERVTVTGSDVRETRPAPGAATVFLHGRITGKTVLNLAYERPRPKAAGIERFEEFSLGDARWTGGTFVVTNTLGESEVLPNVASGLREMALAEIPPSASSILAGPPSIAYEITAPHWSADVELLNLAEFSLTESIADLAHYELVVRPDGSMMGKVSYEVRNRHRQFLRLTLPKDARVILSSVNEEARHLIDVPGGGPETRNIAFGDPSDVYLLPLVRSQASVEGLVSFPVQVVFLARVDTPAAPGGTARLPLPKIDIPIAYAWCETWVPETMDVLKWSGPLRRVDRFSSETATASLEYGSSRLAEGYRRRIGEIPERPPAVPTTPRTPLVPEVSAQPEPMRKPEDEDAYARARLAKNYYRAGKDFYESDDFDSASANLRKVVELLPGSVEAENARRLLSNIQLVKGELELKSKEQKAAGVQVLSTLKQQREQVASQQELLVSAGFKALREGQKSLAFQKLAAAEQLSKSVLSRGESARELSARMGKARETLQEIGEEQEEQAQTLNEEVKKLAAAGRYEDAIRKSEEILKVAPRSDTVVRGNIMALTVQAARQRSAAAAAKAPNLIMYNGQQAYVPPSRPQTFVRITTVEVDNTAVGYTPERGTVQGEIVREARPSLGQKYKTALGVYEQGNYAEARKLLLDIKATVEKEGLEVSPATRREIDRWLAEIDRQMGKEGAESQEVNVPAGPQGRTAGGEGIPVLSKIPVVGGHPEGEAATPDEVRIQFEEQETRTKLSDGIVFLRENDFRRAEQKFVAAQLQIKYGDFPTDFKRKWLAVIQDHLDMAAKQKDAYGKATEEGKNRAAAEKLTEELLRMKEQQMRTKDRLQEQWITFFGRGRYDDALLVLDRMKELDPEDPTILDKIKMTSEKKLEAWRHKSQTERIEQEQYHYAANIEQMTPWHSITRYPENWKELSDRRLKAVEKAQITEKPTDRKVRQQLEETMVSFTFNQQPVMEAIDFLGTLGNMNIVPDRTKFADPNKTVTLKLSNVSLETAIKRLTEQLGLKWIIRDGIVFISDEEGIKRPPETNTYDVRDLLAEAPNFPGPTFELQNIAGNRGGRRGAVGTPGTSIFAEDTGTKKEGEGGRSREEALNDLVELTKQVIEAGTWDDETGHAIRSRAGSIIVTHTPETQAKVQKLLADLRRAKQPQVQIGERITEERARGVLSYNVAILRDDLDKTLARYASDFADYPPTGGVTKTGAAPEAQAKVQKLLEDIPSGRGRVVSGELKRFLDTNYSWRSELDTGRGGLDLDITGLAKNGKLSDPQLAAKLRENLEQKVPVSSVNLNADAERARGLGVSFTNGKNGLAYALIDEAQFRTLKEFSDRNGAAPAAEANPRSQDTIVGTAGLLANGMLTEVRWAGDLANTLDILDNPLKIEHRQYVLVDNGRFLTAVRAGAMQHWTEVSRPLFFVSAPQEIDIPRVGRVVRFEKTLIEPKDELVIQANIYWKGGVP